MVFVYMCIDRTYPRCRYTQTVKRDDSVSEGPHCVYIFLDSSLIQ